MLLKPSLSRSIGNGEGRHPGLWSLAMSPSKMIRMLGIPIESRRSIAPSSRGLKVRDPLSPHRHRIDEIHASKRFAYFCYYSSDPCERWTKWLIVVVWNLGIWIPAKCTYPLVSTQYHRKINSTRFLSADRYYIAQKPQFQSPSKAISKAFPFSGTTRCLVRFTKLSPGFIYWPFNVSPLGVVAAYN